MKVHVVYDAQGSIISMGVPAPLGPDFRGPVFGAQALSGQHVAELEVPGEHSHLTILDLADKLQVDLRTRPHKLSAKP
jgi:hypothetical protein